MGKIVYGSSKLVKVYTDREELIEDISKTFKTFSKRIASIKPIELNPDRYLYLRNRSVSSMESYGPNDNADAFPREELRMRYLTFIGSRLTIDHDPNKVIGMVIDSMFIEPVYSDGKLVTGDYVENILAIDKEKAERIWPGFISLLESGRITDTSMGAYTEYTECSVCSNIAHNEYEYCEHIDPRYGVKGSMVRLASGEEKLAYEICHDVTFFEDSIIVPLELGGTAGGQGADRGAKILEKVASRFRRNDFPLGKYIVDRVKIAQKYQTPVERMPNFDAQTPTTKKSPANPIQKNVSEEPTVIDNNETVTFGEKPKEVEKYEKEKNTKKTKYVKAEVNEELVDNALDYIIELMNQGKTLPDAIEEARMIFKKESFRIKGTNRKVYLKRVLSDRHLLVVDDNGEEYILDKEEIDG